MKKQILKSALIAVAWFNFLPAIASATPTQADYYTIKDADTQTFIDIDIFDPNGVQLLTDASNFLQHGGTFGIYAKDTLTLFTLLDSSKHSSQAFFAYSSGVWTVDYDSDPLTTSTETTFSNVFGFYYTDSNGIHYTDASILGSEDIAMDWVPFIAVASFDYVLTDNTGTYSNTLNFEITTHDVKPIPEPATMLLFGTGLAGLASVARRKKNN